MLSNEQIGVFSLAGYVCNILTLLENGIQKLYKPYA